MDQHMTGKRVKVTYLDDTGKLEEVLSGVVKIEVSDGALWISTQANGPAVYAEGRWISAIPEGVIA